MSSSMIGLVVSSPNHRGMTWIVVVIVNRPFQLLLNKEQPEKNDLPRQVTSGAIGSPVPEAGFMSCIYIMRALNFYYLF